MNMLNNDPDWRLRRFRRGRTLWCVLALAAPWGLFLAAGVARAQTTATPVVIQPGAPGKPSRKLPASTAARLPPRSQAEAEFMRGMIMHHAQAVEMTAL